jgi:hypothetical protein
VNTAGEPQANPAIAPVPAKLVEVVEAARPEHFDRKRAREGVAKGERDNQMFRLACSCRARGLTQEEAEAEVLEAAAKCDPPFSEKIALKKVEQAYETYEAGTRGERLYFSNADGTYRRRYIQTKSGPLEIEPEILANCTVNICRERILDDGVERRRELELELSKGDKVQTANVSAKDFGRPDIWMIEHFGPGSIISAGLSVRDHFRAAVQTLSPAVQQIEVFTHTGWRKIKGVLRYLHAGLTDIAVELPPALKSFRLPPNPSREEILSGIDADLDLLELAPAEVTIPRQGAVYRAPLGSTDFSLGLIGQTGVFKTAMAALDQQHYGAGFTSDHLPGSWMNTPYYNKELAFVAKDALFTVDEFQPGISRTERARSRTDAEQLLRGQANAAGRGRMRSDTTLRDPRLPRCLLLWTGEQAPTGNSLVARSFIVEILPGEVNLHRLTEAQRNGAAGLYAASMAGYLAWLIDHNDQRADFNALRIKPRKKPKLTAVLRVRSPISI